MKRSTFVVGARSPSKLSYGVALVALATAAQLVLAADPDHPHQGDLLSAQALTEALDTYCVKCHNLEDFAGGIALELLDLSNIDSDADAGEKIIRKMSAGVMPPPGQERPDQRFNELIVASLEAKLDEAWAANPRLVPPGAHRLNRAEYENVIRDLLTLEVDAAALLPVDDTSYGFDNMAGSLGSSPALVESYIAAAAKISRLALGHETSPTQKDYLAPADYSQNRHIEGAPFGTRGGLVVQHHFPADGEYVLSWAPIRDNAGGLFGNTTGEMLELAIDGESIRMCNAALQRIGLKLEFQFQQASNKSVSPSSAKPTFQTTI
jgi:hypothetical protein